MNAMSGALATAPNSRKNERGDARPSIGKLTIALATEIDRKAIYRLRHDVYAAELGQHRQRVGRELHDGIDDFNVYIVARHKAQLAGFVSITPPGHSRYSIDKYLSRGELPFECDDGLYEVRLLTVAGPYRRTRTCLLLMYAALRWLEEQGATRVIAIGRAGVLDLYTKAGFTTLGREVISGAVVFELMTAEVPAARHRAGQYLHVAQSMAGEIEWQLDLPFLVPQACHHGGAFFDAIGVEFDNLERRREVINADVLDAWFPPAPNVVRQLNESLAWILRTSPPVGCEGMVKAISKARDVPAASVVPGAGSSSLMFLAFRHWLTPSSRVLVLDPTYGEYAHLFRHVIGCRMDRLGLHRCDGYRVDTTALATRIAGGAYDLVVVVNPNSPTGRHIPKTELKQVLAHAPIETRFWVDETYIEYVGSDESLENIAAASDNIVVCKSMSKVYALSGVRAAYLCAPPRLARELLAITPPWAVSLLGQIAAVEALKDPDYYRRRYRQTRALRDAMFRELERMALVEPVQSQTSFILCHVPPTVAVADLVARCRRSGLFIRDVSSMASGPAASAFRIAVKDADTNRRALDIIRENLAA